MQRQLVRGDSVCLQVIGTHTATAVDLQVTLCEQESADAQRYLFRPSPQRSPTTSRHEDEESENGGSNTPMGRGA